MFVSDFFGYWFHRASHRYAWLWNFHKQHHAIRDWNCLALYGHLLAPALYIPLITVPFTFFFGVDAPHGVVLISAFAFAWSHFIHCDTWVDFGPVGMILCDPPHHKMHHSIDSRHRDVNFAMFPIWDVIFGTYARPEPAAMIRVGIEGRLKGGLW